MDAFADSVAWFVHSAFREIALFAAIGFIIGGIDELMIDLIWIIRSVWRRLTIYTRFPRAFAAQLPDPPSQFRLAVFVPAWNESAVIAQMIAHAVDAYKGVDVTIFVGCYPNDRACVRAARSVSGDDVRVVITDRPGPTTKADCLNSIWRAASSELFDAVVLHDAEDVVSSHEARVLAHLLPRFGLIQLPVVPLIDTAGRLVSGHYCDEFAESHAKTLIVREALGASLPLAGVGCGIRMDVLTRLAKDRGGRPFDDASLTEDYETGLVLGATGCEAAFVRMLDRPGGELVATRAYFPAQLEASIRQKARWMIGIGIAGWDRMGWSGGLVEKWMRLRDRLSLFGALMLFAGYLAFVLWVAATAMFWLTGEALTISPFLALLLKTTLAMLAWRLLMRAYFVARIYGARQGLLSIPRALVANLIAILAARRAVKRYGAMLRDGAVTWDKTAHKFPDVIA